MLTTSHGPCGHDGSFNRFKLINTAIINNIKILIIKREIIIRLTTWPAGWRAPKQSLLQGYNLGELCLTETHLYSVLADYNFWDTYIKKKNSKLSFGLKPDSMLSKM